MRLAGQLGTVPRTVGEMLYAIRWIVMAGIFAESYLDFATPDLDKAEIRIAVIAIATLTLLARFFPGRFRTAAAAVVVVVLDVAFVGLVVYFSGGLLSPFFALFYLNVIYAAAAFGTYGALASATLCGIVAIAVELVDASRPITERLVMDDLLRTIPYLFVVALITGALRDRIRSLAEQSADLRAQRQATEREMEIARSVQMAQLPDTVPEFPGVRIAVWYDPKDEVGGDLYDFYPVDKERVGILVGDVSGHGVPAALLVAVAKYGVREHYDEDLAEMASGLNRHVVANTTAERFVTTLYGRILRTSREFRYFNAGHMPPIVVKPGVGAAPREYADVPLGITADAIYEPQSITIDPGDVLVLYTDGVTDALAAGSDGIEELCRVLADLDPERIDNWGDQVLQATRSQRRNDDSTIVVVKLE